MLRKIVVFGLAISLVIFALQANFASEVVAPVYDRITNLVTDNRSKTVSPVPDFEKTIFSRINEERLKNGQKALIWSDDLAKSAKARGVVVSVLDDYSGTVSGLTIEKAYDLVNYDTSYYGDLYLYVLDKNEDFFSEVMKEKTKRDVVLLDKFTEAGVALAGVNDHVEYYVLFGNRRPAPTPTTIQIKTKQPAKVTWGGPELWTAVNNRRTQFGVGQLTRKDELCTIASIRLNQLLDLGKLDGHAGFKPVLDRPDLKWISEKYNISEFLAQGYSTPEDTVKGWENTLGHRSLLTGGEFVWGCVYSQNSFSVAISAY